MLRAAIKQFRAPRRRVKLLPPDLITPYDVTTVSDDTNLVLLAGKAKDKLGVEQRMKEYGVSTAIELLPLLPKRKPTPFRVRLLNWLRRLEGTSATDPNEPRAEKLEWRISGYTKTKLR